ncbi:hypothetical protein BDW67DRAFT_192900 [Aspergillus spinulosporus]
MQSCDICRKRKVKCDRRTPCARCRRLLQPCTYTDILRKKGPKFVHSYPRIYPTALTASGSSSESVSTPSLMGPLTASVCGSSETLSLPSSMNRNVGMDMDLERPIHVHTSSGIQSIVDSGTGTASEPDEELSLDLDFDFGDLPQGQQLRPQRNSGPDRVFGPDVPLESLGRTVLGLETSLERILSIYVERLHPLFPVADLREIQDTLRAGGCGQNFNYGNDYGFDLSQYALTCSLCAATYAQLAFSSRQGISSLPATMDQKQGDEQACLKYLQAALEAQRQSDHPQVSLTSRQGQASGGTDRNKARGKIVTSFYLFMTYWSLKRMRHAWWYLRECITLLLSARMHQEEEHRKLDMHEAETSRVLFWGVFVAERVPTPLKKEEYVTAIPGFVRLVTLFRGLDVDLSGCWTAAGFVTPISLSRGTGVATTTTDASRTGAGPHGYEYDDTGPETEAGIPLQQLDLAITSEWLRAKMWKLGIPGHQQTSSPREFVAAPRKEGAQWRLEEPLLIGKATLGILQSMEEVLQDNWSGMMDEKLCDICECLCEIRPVMQTRRNGARDVGVEVDPDQILRGLQGCLARLSGRSAYLLASRLGD